MKEIAVEVQNGKVLCAWVGKINISQMTTLLKAMYRFNAISSKILKALFTEIERKS
jgi:hypothetical protein